MLRTAVKWVSDPNNPQPAVLGAGGVSLELAPAALRQSRALIRHPLRAAGATRKGGGAQQPHGPSLRSAWRASARRLRPRGLRVFNPLLAAPAAGCLRGGMRVGARMLRELTRRVCPNGAPQARSELCGEPRKRPAAGLPRSEAQGSQTEGRLFFGDFLLAKQKKVTAPPGEHPGSRPPQKHTINYKNNSYQRLPHKLQTQKTLNISTARNTSSAPPRAPGAAYGCPAPAAAESAAARSRPSPAHRPGPYGAPAR